VNAADAAVTTFKTAGRHLGDVDGRIVPVAPPQFLNLASDTVAVFGEGR